METDVFLELHVPDFEKAIRFYRILGFKIVWRGESYLVMRRGKSIINFYGDSDKVFSQSYFRRFKKNTKRGYAVEIIILIDDIKNFYNKIKYKVKVVEPLKLKRWGRQDFRIEDPFGFYLRFTERYNWIDKKDKGVKKQIKEYKNKRKGI